MATTTNYGWTTPDDTALVKDGASAIRSLGTSVDTTTKNLNPSTTLGDIEYRSSTANTNTRLGVGTTGQILTVAAGVPSWANSAAASFVGCRLLNSANQTISNSTNTALTFDTESFDTDSFHSTATNTSRITIPSGKNGKYLFIGATSWDAANATGRRALEIYKNGASIQGSRQEITPTSTAFPGFCLSVILDAVATDYFEVFVVQTSGGNLATYGSDSAFSAQFLGA